MVPAYRVLILGARGMLGSDLCRCLEKGWEVIPLGREDVDITDRAGLHRKLAEVRPAWVMNCAAFTDVDGAESRPEEAFAVNRDGAANVAAVAAEAGTRLIHFSTDFVFDGKKDAPYREEDPPNPLGIYGQSKWEGEEQVRKLHDRAMVIRTSWTYGGRRSNFVEKILACAEEKNELRVVSDQVGAPTYTLDIGTKVKRIIQADLPGGIYHVTNSGSCTRAQEAERILLLAGVDGVRVIPVPSSEFHSPASRPANSVLENAALAAAGIPLLRPWEEAMAEYMASR